MPASAMGCGLPSPSPKGLDFNGTTIANLCRRLLSGWADRDVIDKTELAGMFDFHFDIDSMEPPDDTSSEPGAPGPPRHANNNAAMFVSVMKALPRLGLKLTPAKGVGEYLVIDHVERPSGN